MGVARVLPLVLGALAVSSEVAVLTFDVIFAVTLTKSSSLSNTHIVSIVASGLGGVTVGSLALLLARQSRYRSGTHIQNAKWRHHTYWIAGCGAILGILSAVASVILLGMLEIKTHTPTKTLSLPTRSMVNGAFVVWAVSLLAQAVFMISIIIIQRKDFQQQIRPYRSDSEDPKHFPEMQETSIPTSTPQKDHQAALSIQSLTPPSTGRSRADSDTQSSFRSSMSHVVRPVTSKTKLLQIGVKSPSYRPQSTRSVDSSHRETTISVEDGFDSWDTSAVDRESREAVASVSPPPQRVLETIPASPPASRSPSPGYPLDLEPPKRRKRSRSYSPANSISESTRSRRISPDSASFEAHIHPLFRTDSPTPPPAATPGTVVTAAFGAGHLLADRQSIRSLSRMRSGSLPTSPLLHTPSLDSLRIAVEREEQDRLQKLEEVGEERTLTPPIPDFVLNGRNSKPVHNSRRKEKVGLGLGMVDE